MFDLKSPKIIWYNLYESILTNNRKYHWNWTYLHQPRKKKHPLGHALGGSFLCQAFQIQPGAAANQHGGQGFFMVIICLIITTTMLGYKQWSTFGNNLFFLSLVIVFSMYKQKTIKTNWVIHPRLGCNPHNYGYINQLVYWNCTPMLEVGLEVGHPLVHVTMAWISKYQMYHISATIHPVSSLKTHDTSWNWNCSWRVPSESIFRVFFPCSNNNFCGIPMIPKSVCLMVSSVTPILAYKMIPIKCMWHGQIIFFTISDGKHMCLRSVGSLIPMFHQFFILKSKTVHHM